MDCNKESMNEDKKNKDQLYYALSVETKKDEVSLWFASEDPFDHNWVQDDLNLTWFGQVCSKERVQFLFIEKEKVDALCYTNSKGSKYVHNSRSNRKRLGIKYKDELLQKTTGVGVEEDYVLMLDFANKDYLALPLLGSNDSMTFFLKKAGVQERFFNKSTLYINKKKVENLTNVFPNGSRVLLNTVEVLVGLGLYYKEGELVPIENHSAMIVEAD